MDDKVRFYCEHFRRYYRTANRVPWQDIRQEAFLVAHEPMFFPALQRSCYRLARLHGWRRLSRPGHPGACEHAIHPLRWLEIPAPETDVASSADGAILHETIDSLPTRYATIIRRHHLEGWTLAEIGAALGVTESRVCQLLPEAENALLRRMIGAEK